MIIRDKYEGARGINSTGVTDWCYSHKDPQRFIVDVEAEGIGDYGQIGLIQNVLNSNRCATYGNGVTITIIPADGSQCLDADPLTIPWYNQNASTCLSTEKTEGRIVLEDAPVCNVYGTIDDKKGKTSNIKSLSVEERFLVSLYHMRLGVVLKQWIWSYEYKITASFRSSPVSNTCETNVLNEKMPIIYNGPIAENSTNRYFSNPGWHEVR
jgi:hypothetical protein